MLIDGEVVKTRDVNEWAAWAKVPENRIVRQEYIGKTLVSTVCLGIDHGINPREAPIIFETMIFYDNDFKHYQARYSTLAAAVAGHEEYCAIVRYRNASGELGN
jgi:hypothetical protein